MAQTEKFMFQNVAYRPTVNKTGTGTACASFSLGHARAQPQFASAAVALINANSAQTHFQ